MRYLRKDMLDLGDQLVYIMMYDISDYNRRYMHTIQTFERKTEISRKYIINYIFCVDKAKFCRHEPRNHVIRKIKLPAFGWQYIVVN